MEPERFALEPEDDEPDMEPYTGPVYPFPLEIAMCPKCRPVIRDGRAAIKLCPKHDEYYRKYFGKGGSNDDNDVAAQ